MLSCKPRVSVGSLAWTPQAAICEGVLLMRWQHCSAQLLKKEVLYDDIQHKAPPAHLELPGTSVARCMKLADLGSWGGRPVTDAASTGSSLS